MSYRRKTWLSRFIDRTFRPRRSVRIPAGDADGYVDWP